MTKTFKVKLVNSSLGFLRKSNTLPISISTGINGQVSITCFSFHKESVKVTRCIS